MRYIRELIADESLSTQFVLIGLLAVALGALLTRAMAFFHHKMAGGPTNISERLECGAMPSSGERSATRWPYTNPSLGVLSFHRSISCS